MNALKSLSKTENDLIVGNYIVLFGGADLVGDFFTKNTNLHSKYTDIGFLYEDFEHGFDDDDIGNSPDNVLGVVNWKSAKVDDKGVFVERVLNRRAEYIGFLEELIDAGIIGTSSEAIHGQVLRKSSGEILNWPLKRDSLTLTPMEPRMLTENVIRNVKSLFTLFPNSKSIASALRITGDHETKPVIDIRTAEKALRDAGFSRSESKHILAHGFKSIDSQRDADDVVALAEQIRRNIATLKN